MNLKNIILFTCLGLCSSCLNNDFMDRSPLDQQTVETVFTNNENFKTYMWQFYVNRSFMVYDYSSYNADISDSYSDNTCGAIVFELN